MSIFNAISLLGGLALFLFGMNVMGNALEKRAGGSLKRILEKLTASPVRGVLLGAGVTAIIQSSSATTVMVVGFVNSGVMTLRQAISVIMGANIGTTMTAWVLSLSGIQGDSLIMTLLKPSSFSPVLAFLGIIFLMLSRSDKRRDTGTILLGFAVLMYGMETMSAAVAPLATVPQFTALFTLFQNPVIGVLVGALVTGIIQSSSASVGILQALSNTGQITFGAAIPILMGQNIGTCVTALISSVGATKNARRAAMVHLYFNVIGTVLFLILFYTVNAIVRFSFIDGPINTVQIAIVHTIFNVTSTLVLLPFLSKLEKLAIRTVKDTQEPESTVVLDGRLLSTPPIAIAQSHRVITDMALTARDTLFQAMDLIDGYDEKKAEQVMKGEKLADEYEDKLGTYLVRLSSHELSREDSREVSRILYTISDFERISDHGVNILETAREIDQKSAQFSDEAKAELKVITAAVREIMTITIDAFETDDVQLATQVEPLEQVIDYLRSEMKKGHIERLQKGLCTIEQGFIFTDLLTYYERVADHCSNIAAAMIEIRSDSMDTHSYLSNVKSGSDPHFTREFARYQEKYTLR